jgi:hypothetical protein
VCCHYHSIARGDVNLNQRAGEAPHRQRGRQNYADYMVDVVSMLSKNHGCYKFGLLQNKEPFYSATINQPLGARTIDEGAMV